MPKLTQIENQKIERRWQYIGPATGLSCSRFSMKATGLSQWLPCSPRTETRQSRRLLLDALGLLFRLSNIFIVDLVIQIVVWLSKSIDGIYASVIHQCNMVASTEDVQCLSCEDAAFIAVQATHSIIHDNGSHQRHRRQIRDSPFR
ncbi:uncharacterized protein PADG_11246 [Paracoccidioides brasiliensis Pb18]|uniref:Uncharacterized protein n=1 Tax=Paracoccidioides brasiliensis (strain Pb18) TaxID=502780 RepID=A0A0A0HYI0_PARBD|nr:uncharacterized protein PADG_11246 [Paracoccidioides brasiliensis Pb18]KGM92430.1 hypothetical protein PADG_11246 [Paracoccidioides brasiliensis Pb18]